MNKYLVAFASRKEFNCLFPQISAVVAASTPVAVGVKYDVCVCGVGVTDFATNLSYFLSKNRYERAFLLGVCGAYPNRDLDVGDVVRVDSEVVGDMGVQTVDGHFLPWGDVSGDKKVYMGETPRCLPLPQAAVRSVAGVTVNCCTGTEYLAMRRAELFNADVESMEGAAFFAVCKRFGVSACEFRAVSNIATDRDPSQWKIAESLANLKEQVLDLL